MGFTGDFALVESTGEAILCLDFLMAGRKVGEVGGLAEDDGDLVGV